MFCGIKYTNNNENGSSINKVTTARNIKREIGIWLMIIVVITSEKLRKDATFIISPIIDINLTSIGLISASIERFVRNKIMGILIGVGVDKVRNVK